MTHKELLSLIRVEAELRVSEGEPQPNHGGIMAAAYTKTWRVEGTDVIYHSKYEAERTATRMVRAEMAKAYGAWPLFKDTLRGRLKA